RKSLPVMTCPDVENVWSPVTIVNDVPATTPVFDASGLAVPGGCVVVGFGADVERVGLGDALVGTADVGGVELLGDGVGCCALGVPDGLCPGPPARARSPCPSLQPAITVSSDNPAIASVYNRVFLFIETRPYVGVR